MYTSLQPLVRAHAAERWTHAIIALLDAPSDPRSLELWGRHVGVSLGTLRAWCRAAGVSAKASLDFARLLRAVLQSRGSTWDPQNLLDVVDDRTLRRLTERGGIAEFRVGGAPPTIETFLASQRLVTREADLTAVCAALSVGAPTAGIQRRAASGTVSAETPETGAQDRLPSRLADAPRQR